MMPISLSLRKRRRERRPALLLLAPLLLCAAPAFAADTKPLVLSAAQMQRAAIRTEAVLSAQNKAQDTTPNGGLHLSGKVVASPEASMVVSSQVSGIVQQVSATPWQPVQAGAPLLTLYSQQLMEWQRDYVQAATQAKLAKNKQNRDEQLFRDGIIAEARLQESRANAAQAEVAASERRQSLLRAGMGDVQLKQLLQQNQLNPVLVVRSPAGGTLGDMAIQSGQHIEAGMPLTQVVRPGKLALELQATLAQAAQLRPGDMLQVNQCAQAKVTGVANQLQSASQTRLVRAQLLSTADCLQLNQFAEATLQSASIPAGSTGVRSAALISNGKQEVVFVRQKDGFLPLPVKVLARQGEYSWLQADPKNLPTGAEVAVQGMITLKGMWLGLGAEEKGGS